MFHMQSTYLLKLTVGVSLQFFSVPLLASTWGDFVLHIVTCLCC